MEFPKNDQKLEKKMCFPHAQGCRKGGPNTKWFGKNANIGKLRFWVEKMRGRTESTNFDVLISNFNTRDAEMAKNGVSQNIEKCKNRKVALLG